MPLLAYAAARALNLPQEAVVGMVILGACPGGVSANVMSYLTNANSALTVLLTILTTMLSPFLTPLIIHAFFHHDIVMDLVQMMEKLFWVVLFPLLDAIIIRRFLFRYVEPVQHVFPSISIIAVGLIIGYVAAANCLTLIGRPWLIILSVLIFNLGGYAIGYLIGGLCRFDSKTRLSLAFEYGMQDSSLGIMLATSFFTVMTALPCAICSLLQNLTGPVLVSGWNFGKKDVEIKIQK
jgi:BASS family bile acid:Na+ symporter